jgi:hypothetical protein
MQLCFIEDRVWAYFTTQEVEKQKGEDWHKIPWEHNAGVPYQNGMSQIKKLAFQSPHSLVGINTLNSRYSVEQINQKVVPWLFRPQKYTGEYYGEDIFAGESIETFVEKIKEVGGKVYEEKE